jgi:hypothetical protein
MSCSVDIVGYSKLVIDKQTELAFELPEIVRSSEQFHRANGKLYLGASSQRHDDNAGL